MKRFYVLLMAALVVAILPAIALSQLIYFPDLIEYNALGGGARAAGMGGAFLGLSEGEYGFSWNPAGMIFAEKRSIGLQFVSGADKFTFPSISAFDTVANYSVNQAELKRSHFNLDFSGFVTPFSVFDRQWAVGGGYRNVYDMEFKYDAIGNFNSKDVFTQTDGVDAITISLAGKLIEGIGIGISANNYIRGTESNLFAGRQVVISYPGSSITDTVDIWYNNNSHYSGFNMDIGISGEFSMVKASAVIHTPYDLTQKAKITRFFMIQPTPIGLIDRVTVKTNIPLAFSLGISVKPIEKLIVAVDFENRRMSQSNIDYNWESTLFSDNNYDPHWEDLNQFRIGAEYMVDAGFADIPVRAGFRNNPSVAKELTSYIGNVRTYGSQINTNIMTFGSGLRFEKAWIDLAYQFGSGSYNSTFNFGSEQSTEKVIEQKRDYSRLLISAGMNF